MSERGKLLEAYQEYACEKQIIILWIINGLCVTYGIMGYFFLSDMFNNSIHGKSEYKALIMCSLIMLIILTIGRFFISKENVKRRRRFSDFLAWFCSQLYLTWAVMDVYYSALEHRNTNIIIWLMVLAVVSTSFIFHPMVYAIIFIYNCGAVSLLLHNIGPHGYNTITVINIGIFAFVLAGIYYFRHSFQLRAFERQLELNHLYETRTLLATSMNHELRTPLNSIIGNTQLLLSEEDLCESCKETISNIYDSSITMVQLVNDLLDFSRMEAGEFTIIPAPFDLTELRNHVEAMLENQATAKGLRFSVTVDEGTAIDLVGDMRRIQQIVINIGSNAIKYTEYGQVKISFCVRDSKLHVKVRDTGMGMQEETIKELFTPFKRLNESKTTTIQGTGLGMYIVKSLCDSMGGEVHVDSEPDIGTIMRVDIPIEIVDGSREYVEATRKIEAETNAINLTKYDFAGKTILSVDDTVMNNKIIEKLLKKTGAEVVTMLDGERCLKYLENHKADVILLDHMMPGMNGIECLSKIRSGPDTIKNIPVIMLTGNAGSEFVEMYKENGANGYITKPVMQDKLCSEIKKALG